MPSCGSTPKFGAEAHSPRSGTGMRTGDPVRYALGLVGLKASERRKERSDPAAAGSIPAPLRFGALRLLMASLAWCAARFVRSRVGFAARSWSRSWRPFGKLAAGKPTQLRCSACVVRPFARSPFDFSDTCGFGDPLSRVLDVDLLDDLQVVAVDADDFALGAGHEADSFEAEFN